MNLDFTSSIKSRFTEKADTLFEWQEKCYYFILLSICLAALPALINSSIKALNDEAWASLCAYVAGYFLCLVITFFNKIPFKIRIWTGVIIVFGLGTLNIFSVGPTGSGRVWLFTAAIFTTLILGIRPGILILFAQSIVLTIFQILLNNDFERWSKIDQYSPQAWTTTSITLIFLSVVCVLAMGRLIRGLSISLDESRDKSSQLEKTGRKLIQRIKDHHETIASLKESEERWHFALEGAGDGVWDWDVAGKQVQFSSRWKEMLGYGKNEIGNDIGAWFSRIHPEDKEEVIHRINKYLGQERPDYKFQYRIRCKDKSYRWILDRGKVMRFSDDGNPSRIIGTHTDITLLKELERQQTQYEIRLQQTQKMEAIGTLAGGIAHDFNNILGAIIGYTELSQKNIDDKKKVSGHLNKILTAGYRAKDLVQQILTFSRQTEQETIPLKVRLIVKEVLKLIRASLPATIEIHEEIESDSIIIGNPTQIHQVVMNLCTNAAHAMKEKGGRLSVGLISEKLESSFIKNYPDLSAGEYVKIIVKDTGSGISPNLIERLFDPFFTTKEKGEGTGLGLSVVHGIVKSLKGEIIVESSPGKGSCFTVLFPVAEAVEKDEKMEEPIYENAK